MLMHTTSQKERQHVLADERKKVANRTACQNAHKRHRTSQHTFGMRNLWPNDPHFYEIHMTYPGRMLALSVVAVLVCRYFCQPAALSRRIRRAGAQAAHT